MTKKALVADADEDTAIQMARHLVGIYTCWLWQGAW